METITITKADYLRMLEAELTLEALEAMGVDNWGGYDEVDWGSVQDGLAGARAALGMAE